MKTILKITVVLGLLLSFPAQFLFSQVSINTDNTLPDNSALLDLKSTSKGLLIPRMNKIQRDAVVSPAEGLIIFCIDCQPDGSPAFTVYYSGIWHSFLSCVAPSTAPLAGTHVPSLTQILWKWNIVTDATGYKWNTTNNYSTALDMNGTPEYMEGGLTCDSIYTRYVWAFNTCGYSSVTTLTQATLQNPLNVPSQLEHIPSPTQIIWNWTTVAGATGYKWNTTNDYTSATDMGTTTSKTETGLTCNTAYTRYAWAYSTCSNSTALAMDQTTSDCPFICGSSIIINHTAGDVAPVTKTVTYATVTNIPVGTSKCWITSNLGADHQATSKDDATEASAGWYWQFNLKQGYKHDGTTRTPNTIWLTTINENLDWQTANDPCALELGSGWHIPTYTEWFNVDATGGWTEWTGPWNSGLKLHAAGYLVFSSGSLVSRGIGGYSWSSTQYDAANGWSLHFNISDSAMHNDGKAGGFSLRCIRD